MKKRSHSTGMSGVYYVAAELSPPIGNYTASVTSRNAKAVDIIAMNNDTLKSIGIQVKTNAPSSPHSFWLVNKSDKILRNAKLGNLVYLFVNLDKKRQHSYFIVPAKDVKPKVRQNKSKTRWYIDRDDIENYLNRWDIVKSMTS